MDGQERTDIPCPECRQPLADKVRLAGHLPIHGYSKAQAVEAAARVVGPRQRLKEASGLKSPDREIDVPGLTGRSPYRIPKPLQGRVTFDRLTEVVSDSRVNPDSGWLISQKMVETYVETLPEAMRFSRRWLYDNVYDESWLYRVGDMIITHQQSIYWRLEQHPAKGGRGAYSKRSGVVTNCSPGSAR